jgi:glutathione S-transferase
MERYVLLGSTRSPFTRKVRIAAAVAGVELAFKDMVVSQFRTTFDTALGDANPLLQIPVLLRESGDAIVDSSVIAQFIDLVGTRPGCLTGRGEARIAVLAQEAAGDNFLGKAVRRVEEMRKDETLRSQSWLAANEATLERQLDRWDAQAERLPRHADLGAIALVVAIDYIGFRLPEIDPLDRRPQLAAFHAAQMAGQPAFATIPFAE